MKRFALFLAAGLALAAGGAYAASSGVDGQPMRPPGTPGTSSIQPGFVGGIYEPDTSVRVLRFDIGGNLLTSDASRDRDYWVLQESGIQATDIPARSIFKSPQPFSTSDFTALSLMVSWAASDTDSVALEIMVMGKISGNPADGLDYFIDLDPSTSGADGIFIADALVGAAYKTHLLYSRVHEIPRSGLIVNGGALLAAVKGKAAGTTTNAALVPLTEFLGEFASFPVVQIWVINRLNKQMDDVTISYWAKVK